MPAAAQHPRPPAVAGLEELARQWLAGRDRDLAGWLEVLEAAAVNLQHGFAGAVLAAAQLGRPELAASPRAWEKDGWRPAPGEQPRAWLVTGTGMLRRASPVLGISQVEPPDGGPARAAPGAGLAVAGGDVAGALAAFARSRGLPLEPAPAGLAPARAAGLTARRVARLLLGDYVGDGAGLAAACDSVTYIVLRRAGGSPRGAMLQFPPARAWAAGPDELLAAGARITRAAAAMSRHCELLLAPLPPPPPGRDRAPDPPPRPHPGRRPRPGPVPPARVRPRPVAPGARAAPQLAAVRRRPDPDLVRANEAAARFFAAQLAGSWAGEYLAGRGFGPGVCAAWGLGYAAAGWRSPLLNHFRRTPGLGQDLAVAAGLAVRNRRGQLADLWRDRVMIPVRDESGNLVAFAGRAAPDAPAGTPKYLNTPETSIYRKHEVLFGLAEARAALAAGAAAVLEEGYFDVIATTVAGGSEFAGVASCGTSLSAEQMARLAWAGDLCRVPLLDARDADAAGRKAAARDYAVIVPWCRSPRVPRLPEGADPADVFTRGGPAALLAVLRQTVPLADTVVDAVLDRWDRQLNWPDPETAPLVNPWDANTQVEAVRAAVRELALAAPAEPALRQLARIAERTGLPYAHVVWESARQMLPAGVLAQDPDWGLDIFGRRGSVPGQGPSRDPPGPVPGAFPVPPAAARPAPRPQAAARSSALPRSRHR